LHVRLAREGGLDQPDADTGGVARPPWDQPGIHGLPRAREWDAVVSVEAPEIPEQRSAFVALPSGDLVVEDGTDQVRALADALERELAPPYRAEAVKRDDGFWAVAGRRVEIVELPGVAGNEIELTSHGPERTLLVDGERGFGSIPELERPGHVVRARRVDGDIWEVETARL
jgi:hypothetical protein